MQNIIHLNLNGYSTNMCIKQYNIIGVLYALIKLWLPINLIIKSAT